MAEIEDLIVALWPGALLDSRTHYSVAEPQPKKRFTAKDAKAAKETKILTTKGRSVAEPQPKSKPTTETQLPAKSGSTQATRTPSLTEAPLRQAR
jgi:hypothetical protein